MMSADFELDRISPAKPPAGVPIGWQNWRNLLFLHWRVPVDQIRPLIPRPLELDTWGGETLVAVVPFAMERVRPWWSPPVPGVSWFLETNVRTYVHYQGVPGVWFHSLEASNSLAVALARLGWGLAYYRSTMTLRRCDRRIHYTSRRRWPGKAGTGCDVEIEVGDDYACWTWPDSVQGENRQPAGTGQSPVGTLEHFLAERYYLFTVRNGKLLRGQVHHTPYPLKSVEVLNWSDSLLASNGIVPIGGPCHAAFSSGVDVAIHPLTEVGRV